MVKDERYWNDYAEEVGYNPNFMKDIPIEFQNQEMWDNYVKDGALNVFGLIDVPKKFQTQEMWNKFLCEVGIKNIKKVPVEFQSTELWTEYLNKKDYLYTTVQEVPSEFQTQEMWNESMKRMGYNPYFVDIVPEKFLTIEILRNVLKNKDSYRQFDFHDYQLKLKNLEEIHEETHRKKVAQSYIVNQERDYETGARFAPYGNDENYLCENLPSNKKAMVAKKVEANLYGERDYETGSRADSDLETEYEREM